MCNTRPDERSGELADSLWIWLSTSVQKELETLGFGRGRALDSREFQVLGRWHDLLEDFGALDVVVSAPVKRGFALRLLTERASGATFRERNPGCPVEILGVEEALGSRFDAAWITTLDADTWPGAARRDPLIPGPVQADVPAAGGDGKLQRARLELAGLARTGEEILGSFSSGSDDQQRQRSQLVEALEVVEPAESDDPATPLQLERIDGDIHAPVLAASGTGLDRVRRVLAEWLSLLPRRARGILDSMPSNRARIVSIVDEVRHRRLPQMMIGYVVGLWGGAQVIDFVEQRYALSPYWVELFVVAYLVLLPSVVAVTWNKGAPGHQRWSRAAIGTLSVNILLAVAVLVIGFHGRDLGRVTETVTVETEEGDAVTRDVAREAFRRTVMLSIPDVEELSGEDRWLGVDFEQLLEIDLAQNPFLVLRPPWVENQRAQRAGLEDASRMPRALVHDVAHQRGADVFLMSSLHPAESGFDLEIEIISTEDGRRLDATTLGGSDVFDVADRASIWINRSLKVPQVGFDDRPVTDLMTESPEALRASSKGAVAFHLESEFEKAAQYLARATELDPTFALAHLSEYSVNLLLGRMSVALPAIEAAMQHSYRLTERSEFLVRAYYHGARSDIERTLAVLEMWARLHPADPMPRRLLARNRAVTGGSELALESMREVLELVPGDVGTLEEMVELSSSVGDLETAAEAARRWAEHLPNEVAPMLALSRVQRDRGDLEKTELTLERALLLEPTHVDTRMALADLATRQGDLDEAARVYAELAEGRGTAQDRFEAIGKLVSLRRRQGRIDDALEHFARWEELARKVLPAGQRAVQVSMQLHLLAIDGRADEARSRLNELRTSLVEPFTGFISIGDALVALAAEDTATAGPAIDASQRTIEATGVGNLQWLIEILRARERILSGDLHEAIAACDRAHALDPSNHAAYLHRSRALLHLGRFDEALTAVDRSLEADPAHPVGRLLRGRVLAEAGRVDEAIGEYERALRTWEDSDEDFDRAGRARSELEALRRSS